MELDNIKELWKNQQTPSPGIISNEQVVAMINHPSKSPVAIMKRNLKRELWFLLVSFSIAAFIFFISFNGKMIAYSWAYIFMMVVFLFYYYFKNKLLNSMQCVTCEVKSNLTLQLKSLEKYIKNNLLYSTLTLPAFLMFGALIMYLDATGETHKSVIFYSIAHPAWLTTLIWLGFSVILTIPLYFLNKKYLHWLYGKHINRLRLVISNMEND